jgi:hypothetical protein
MTHTQLLRAAGGLVAVALLGAFAAGPARADVRLQEGGSGPEEPGLAIRLSPAGPWSLVGPFDSTVLNPAGDSYSDGLPDDAPQGDDLLAGWVRPGDGRVHLSFWNDSSWTPLQPFEGGDSVGVPRIDALGEGWAVVWQQLHEEPIIRAGGVGSVGEHHDSEPIIHGWLLDVNWMDDIQLVLHQSPDRSALILTGVLWSVPGVPSPVDIVFSVELGPLETGDGNGGYPSPELRPIQRPGGKNPKVVRGAWSKRVAINWWSPEGELKQAIADWRGDVRFLDKPRFEPGNGLTGTLVGAP